MKRGLHLLRVSGIFLINIIFLTPEYLRAEKKDVAGNFFDENKSIVLGYFTGYSGASSSGDVSDSKAPLTKRIRLHVEKVLKGDLIAPAEIAVDVPSRSSISFIALAVSTSARFSIIAALSDKSPQGVYDVVSENDVFYISEPAEIVRANDDPSALVARSCLTNLSKLSGGTLLSKADFGGQEISKANFDRAIFYQSINGLKSLSATSPEVFSLLAKIGKKVPGLMFDTLAERLKLGDKTAIPDMLRLQADLSVTEDEKKRLEVAHADYISTSTNNIDLVALLKQWPSLGDMSKRAYLNKSYGRNAVSAALLRVGLSDPDSRVRYHALKAIYTAAGAANMPARTTFSEKEQEYIEAGMLMMTNWISEK